MEHNLDDSLNLEGSIESIDEHSQPDVKWLLEPIDIYNVNAPPTSRYKF